MVRFIDIYWTNVSICLVHTIYIFKIFCLFVIVASAIAVVTPVGIIYTSEHKSHA